MALAIVYSRATTGMNAPLVTVEAHISAGLAGFYIVGLPEKAVKESKDRVRSAFINSKLEFPDRRITINLAPADLPKEGGRFDLPIALGILAASGQIPMPILERYEWVGELALSGELRAVKGVLPVVLAAHRANRRLVVPIQNATEAGLVGDDNVFAASHLLDVCLYLRGEKSLPACQPLDVMLNNDHDDLSDVCGQSHAKRALEIAAAGRHSLLFLGPPGTGKTMLASRLPGILPQLTEDEALEVAAVASISRGGFHSASWKQIPFRAPHHSSSSPALVGGGNPPQPGEISLAHQGVLFLDELPEFNRHVLDALREPLESGFVTISRATQQSVFPAQFQFIAAMNPCPCGYAGSTTHFCRCTSDQVKRYIGKISGPLLDRIDMHVEVARLPPDLLLKKPVASQKMNAQVQARVLKARQRQIDRQGKLNHLLAATEFHHVASLTDTAQHMLQQITLRFNLSARVYHRLIKLARTIADLEGCDAILDAHVGEALSYRCLDRQVVG